MACKNCEAFRVTVESLEATRRYERDRAGNLQRMLEEERAKPSVENLLKTASAAAQIAKLSANAFPEGGPVADEASSVALGALKQICARLEGGTRCTS